MWDWGNEISGEDCGADVVPFSSLCPIELIVYHVYHNIIIKNGNKNFLTKKGLIICYEV
jgi:hypothetical protein